MAREGCCIVALQPEGDAVPKLLETIRELAPMEKDDLLAEDGAGRVLLIKGGEDPAEAAEFAMALLDTVEGETGIRLKAGVSAGHAGPAEWPAGYREAVEAIRTGERFARSGRVQVYGDQALERLLSELPAESRKRFRKQLAAGKDILTPETRETAERFFEADLNLSVAARQMFIHRNTLTYRLDRIQKETGLDLRKFNDAVIFRVLMSLAAAEEEKD